VNLNPDRVGVAAHLKSASTVCRKFFTVVPLEVSFAD